MKKYLVLAVVAIMSITASAQVYLGGSLGYVHNNDLESDVFKFAPEVGYNLNEKWAIGASIDYTWVKDDYNMFTINPYARYTYFTTDLVSLFVDGGFDLGIYSHNVGDSSTVWGIGFKPGISLNFSKRFSLVAHLGFLGYQDLKEQGKVFGIDLSNNLSFGFYYNF